MQILFTRPVYLVVFSLLFFMMQGSSFGQDDSNSNFHKLTDTYRDESHCLTVADMRGTSDMHISCFCRDAIVDARYVYSTYISTGKDNNLDGVFLTLQDNVRQKCGESPEASDTFMSRDWKWYGPEVSRTYPSDEVIERIKPETRNGKAVGRWVPFKIQLIYRDDRGEVIRTENYSSRELIPILPALPVLPGQNKDK